MYSLNTLSKEFEKINQTNIPIYEYPEDATHTISKIIEYNLNRERILKNKNLPLIEINIDYSLIQKIILDNKNEFLPLSESIKILKILNLNTPKYKIIDNIQDLENINLEYPLVMKSLSPEIIHKTEKEAVILNIKIIKNY
jgi:acyl-CoA synthetase (NDP forming)